MPTATRAREPREAHPAPASPSRAHTPPSPPANPHDPRQALEWQNDALTHWVHVLRDPHAATHDKLQAWRNYQAAANQGRLLSKAYNTANTRDTARAWRARDVLHEFEAVLQQELQRLPQSRRPRRTELQGFIDDVSQATADRLVTLYEDQAQRAYQGGMQEVSSSLGVDIPFGGRHQESLDTIMSGEGLADAYENFADTMAQTLNGVLIDHYKDGNVDPGSIVVDMIDHAGHQVRSDLERIARSETWKTWETARANAHEDAENILGQEFLYAMVRDLPPTRRGNPQCGVCSEIINRTRDGVPLDELKRIIIQVSTDPQYGGHPSWDPTRDGNFPLPHPNCRHRHVRVSPDRTRNPFAEDAPAQAGTGGNPE